MKFRTYVAEFLKCIETTLDCNAESFYGFNGRLSLSPTKVTDEQIRLAHDSTEDDIWQAMHDLWKRHIGWPVETGHYMCDGVEYDTCMGPDVIHYTNVRPSKVLRLHETTSNMRFTKI